MSEREVRLPCSLPAPACQSRKMPAQQRAICGMLCLGLEMKEIAARLGKREGTVKVYATDHIYPRFGVHSRAELMVAVLAVTPEQVEAALTALEEGEA